MKKYETWELLRLAKYFKQEGIPTDTRTRYKNSEGIEVVIGEGSFGKGLFTPLGVPIKSFIVNEQWTLVEEPIPFREASLAFENGKNIRCEYISSDDERDLVIDIFKQSSTEELGIMEENSELTFYMVNVGKWFIEAEEI